MPRKQVAENYGMSTALPAIVMECLGCQRSLKLPGTAAGRVVKCPACGGMSPVPRPQAAPGADREDELGDLLSEMFNEGHDDEDDFDHEDDFDTGPAQTRVAVPEPVPAPAPAQAPTPTPAPAPAPEAATDDDEIVLQEAPPATAEAARPEPEPKTEVTTPRPTPTPASAATPSAPVAGASHRGELNFLQTGPPSRGRQPFLAVSGCSIAGVEIIFPESQLSDPLFRISMPQRCVVTGQPRGAADLNARPMVFINADEQGNRQARAIETQYEMAVDPSFQARDYIGNIGLVDGLLTPFNRPMPYMVSADLFEASLNCLSIRSDHQEAYCRVMIPAAVTAAEWIANVNGTANAAWHYLNEHACRLSCEAWIRMPSRVRDRISAWCTFVPGESFIAYARHADNTAGEAGLGGLLVTDQRLVYQMYRKKLEFPLDRPLKVRVRRDEHGMSFAAGSDGQPLKKLGTISFHEVPLVFEALESAAAALTVETVGQDVDDTSEEGPDLAALFAA